MYHEINGHIWEYLLWVECSRRTSKVTWSRVSVTSRQHLSTARADGAEASVFSRPRISTVMDMALLPFYHKNICLPFIHEGLFIILLVSFRHITQLQPTGFSLSRLNNDLTVTIWKSTAIWDEAIHHFHLHDLKNTVSLGRQYESTVNSSTMFNVIRKAEVV